MPGLSLTLEQRQKNVVEHAKMLAEVLARPTVKGQLQRIYRARIWMEMVAADILSDAQYDYLVMTLVQSTTAQKLKLYVTRPFTQALGPASTAQLELSGAYSVDEIIAFLTLDRVPVEEMEWRDETSSGIVLADVLGNFQG